MCASSPEPFQTTSPSIHVGSYNEWPANSPRTGTINSAAKPEPLPSSIFQLQSIYSTRAPNPQKCASGRMRVCRLAGSSVGARDAWQWSRDWEFVSEALSLIALGFRVWYHTPSYGDAWWTSQLCDEKPELFRGEHCKAHAAPLPWEQVCRKGCDLRMIPRSDGLGKSSKVSMATKRR